MIQICTMNQQQYLTNQLAELLSEYDAEDALKAVERIRARLQSQTGASETLANGTVLVNGLAIN